MDPFRSRAVRILPICLALCAFASSRPTPDAAAAQPATAAAGVATVRFVVNSAASRHRISPFIYGMNQFDWGRRSKALKLGRLGGNRFTAYNWETNASNAGSDYRHQNDDNLGGGDTPGEAVARHVEAAHRAGASMIVTVPIAGYVAADKNKDGDVNQTPDFLRKRFLESQPAKGAPYQYPPDLKDRVVYQDEFVAWLEGRFPESRRDPERTIFYSLDNEPELWTQTHPRIRPNGKLTYAELVERTTAFAAGIKHAAPAALVFGPVSYGWSGFVSLQERCRPQRPRLPRLLPRLDEGCGGERRAPARRRARPALVPGGARWGRAGDRAEQRRRRRRGARAGAALAVGPVVRGDELDRPERRRRGDPPDPADEGEDRGALPRHAARHHGVQLRRRQPHLRRPGASGRARHTSAARACSPLRCGTSRGARASRTPRSRRSRDFDGAGGRFGGTSVEASTSDDATSSVYASLDEGRDDRLVLVAINKTAEPIAAQLQLGHPVALTRDRRGSSAPPPRRCAAARPWPRPAATASGWSCRRRASPRPCSRRSHCGTRPQRPLSPDPARWG